MESEKQNINIINSKNQPNKECDNYLL